MAEPFLYLKKSGFVDRPEAIITGLSLPPNIEALLSCLRILAKPD
jgi:hypothetical protein